MKRGFLIYFNLFLIFISGIYGQTNSEIPESKAANFFSLITGSFISTDQATEFPIFKDFTLHIYPIWASKPEHWMYMEMAPTKTPNEPFLKKVYKIEEIPNDIYQCTEYQIKGDSAFIGKWQDLEYFNQFDTTILVKQEGCEVILGVNEAGGYAGAIHSCESNLRGALFTISKLNFFPDRIISWEQGYDTDYNQVWGPVVGGYILDRVE